MQMDKLLMSSQLKTKCESCKFLNRIIFIVLTISLMLLCGAGLTHAVDAGPEDAIGHGEPTMLVLAKSRKHRSEVSNASVYDGLPRPIPKYPFTPENIEYSDILHYEVGWNKLAAARGWVKIKSETLDGRKLLRIRGEARTIGLAGFVWPMYDWAETVTDPATLEPRTFTIYRDEAGEVSLHYAEFNRAQNEVCVLKAPEPCKVQWISKAGWDPGTFFMAFRSQKIEVGDVFYYDIFEGDERYLIKFYIDGRERIKIRAGEFDALRIKPQYGSLPPEPPEGKPKISTATMWVSDDERRLPLKVTSKVFVGSVYGELTKIEKIQ